VKSFRAEEKVNPSQFAAVHIQILELLARVVTVSAVIRPLQKASQMGAGMRCRAKERQVVQNGGVGEHYPADRQTQNQANGAKSAKPHALDDREFRLAGPGPRTSLRHGFWG
jgi:hypothetical protein